MVALVSAFADTRKGANQLKQIMAGLGAVLDNVKQRFAAVGGFITGLFQGGPTKALENYNELTKDLSNNLGDVFRQAQQLEKDAQALRNSQRELGIVFAESRAQIKEYNKIAEDTTKGIDERIAAAEKANEIEIGLQKQREEAAAEELRIAQERAAMSDSSEEDLDNLAQLEIALINIRTESAEMQTTLQNKVNMLHQERKRNAEAERAQQEADAEAKRKEDEAELERLRKLAEAEQAEINARYERQDQLDLVLQSEQDQEISAVVKKYEALFALADEFGYGEEELREQQRKALEAVNKKYDDREVAATQAREKAKAMAIQQGRQMALQGAMTLLSAGAKTAKQQKKLAIAQVLLSQGQAMATAVKNAQLSATATGPGAIFSAPGFTATAIGLVLGTFGQIKSILNQADANANIDTSLPGITRGGGGGATAGGGGDDINFRQALLPNLQDLLQDQAGVNTLQAFVVQSQLDDQQAMSEQINFQSSL